VAFIPGLEYFDAVIRLFCCMLADDFECVFVDLPLKYQRLQHRIHLRFAYAA
jgi:hypothetical protein